MTEEKKSLEDLKELKEKDAVTDIETSEVKETVSSKDDLGRSYATGKRKDAVARVWIKKGAGVIKHDDDHRILMSFFIANMICKKNNIIKDKSCVKTSYPTFFKHISQFSN